MGRSPGRPPALAATIDEVLLATQSDDAAAFFEAAAAVASVREAIVGWCRLVPVASVGSLEGVGGTAAVRVERV